MFTADDVRARLRDVPFQPWRIVASSGEHYDVMHSDSALVTRRILYVGICRPQRRDVPHRAASVSLLHVTDWQPLPEPRATDPHS